MLKLNSATSCDSQLGSIGINSNRTILSNGIQSSVGLFTATPSIYYEVNTLEQVFDRAFANMPNHDYDKVILMIRPLYFNARVGLIMDACKSDPASCTNKSTVVAGPYTTVQSTGYFGSVVKKLSADIDRQSGTLYDLFDYVVYKKS